MMKKTLMLLVSLLLATGAALADPGGTQPPALQKEKPKTEFVSPIKLCLPGIVVEEVDVQLHTRIERDFGAFLMEKLYDHERSLLNKHGLLEPSETWAGK